MGPFELMDLIGIDVNFEVAQSFYEQSSTSRAGSRIRSRSGWSPRAASAARPGAASTVPRRPAREPAERAGRARRAGPRGVVLERIVAQLVNEASFAVEEGVAEPADIDTAMRLGLNHPRGPFEWRRELGAERVAEVLDELAAELGRALPRGAAATAPDGFASVELTADRALGVGLRGHVRVVLAGLALQPLDQPAACTTVLRMRRRCGSRAGRRRPVAVRARVICGREPDVL